MIRFKSWLKTENAVQQSPIEKDDNAALFAKGSIQAAIDRGYPESVIDGKYLQLWHGTSEKNQRSILRSGKFVGFPFFSLDEETAMKFSRQAGGKPAHSIYLFTARKPLLS